MIVDGHLDLAINVVTDGRDYTRSVAEIRGVEQRTANQATVSLPELVRGGVGLVFATLFAEPEGSPYAPGGYRTPAEAEAQALEQLDLYRRWEDEGRVRLIRTRTDLDAHVAAWPGDPTIGTVVLMEGADPIVRVEDLARWWDRGVRIVGPAWHRTRYTAGSDAPGTLTGMGRELAAAMRDLGVAFDASHMAEHAFWEVLEIGVSSVIASHSNPRALVPGDRQLSDEMIDAIGGRDGMIGIVLYNAFLSTSWNPDVPSPTVTLTEHVRAHLDHVANVIGWDRVGIGSDLDGGLGLEETPVELDTVADLGRIGDLVPPSAAAGVLGGNWLRWLRSALPAE